MAEYTAPATLTTPGGTILFNRSTDILHHDPMLCSGLDGAPLRAEGEDAARADGGLWYPALKGPRRITLSGTVRFTGTVASRTTVEDGLMAACESIHDETSGQYSWNLIGGTTRTLTVFCEILPTFQGNWKPFTYIFGLFAENPNWVVT